MAVYMYAEVAELNDGAEANAPVQPLEEVALKKSFAVVVLCKIVAKHGLLERGVGKQPGPEAPDNESLLKRRLEKLANGVERVHVLGDQRRE